MAPKEQPEQIRLEQLSAQQLFEIRQQLNSDIQRFGEGLQTLNRAAAQFAATKKSVDQLGASSEGQQMLLPLTSSIYVSGEIAAVDKVMVELGTGYFVEMTIEDAQKYCDRRVKGLQENMSNINNNLRERQNKLMQVQAVLAEKMQAAQHQQALAAQGAK